jgi:hypothetical protein
MRRAGSLKHGFMKLSIRACVPLVIVAIGPTLIVPIQEWHHHDDHASHEDCALCTTAATTVADVPIPPVITILPCFAVPAIEPGDDVLASAEQPQPVARGPPSAATDL